MGISGHLWHENALMKYLLFVFFFASSAISQTDTPRPQITGIDHVAFYTTAPDATAKLYVKTLGALSIARSEPGITQQFDIGSQWVGYSPARDAKATSRLNHVAFTTNDAEGLRRHLASLGFEVPNSVVHDGDGILRFAMGDPEGNRIEFVQRGKFDRLQGGQGDPVSRRMIHAGFIVHDRALEDRFYKDALGFHLYWHGGMEQGRTDWVAMQVPDGTDWLEYMLNQPPNPDLRQNGVMDHISLGVRDMKQAQAKLEAHGWKSSPEEHSQMGKDGKWQLNLFDPDYTRIELMEFRPAQKPCCAEFTGPHPSGTQ